MFSLVSFISYGVLVKESKDALSGTVPKSYMVVPATPAYVKTVKLLEKLTHTGKHRKATEKFLDKLTREYQKIPSDDSCEFQSH